MGSNPCRKLSLLGIAHLIEGLLFQVQGVYRRTVFRRKPGCGFGYSFCITCIKTLNFDICLVKSNLLTLELLYIVGIL